MTKQESIKLSDNLHLYSGDVITINNSKPLLVEVVGDQEIKLRDIKKNKYLTDKKSLTQSLNVGTLTRKSSNSKLTDKKPLYFSTSFANALIFTVENNDSRISLRNNDNKYLKLKSKEFCLSSEEEWLTISKQQNAENIVNFEEMLISGSHKGEETIKDENLKVEDHKLASYLRDHSFSPSEVKLDNLEQRKSILKYWQDNIHVDFTSELLAEWKKWGFNDEQCQQWIESGLEPHEAQFAKWLVNKKECVSEEKKEKNNFVELEEIELSKQKPWKKQRLIEQYSDGWGIIHPDFAKVDNDGVRWYRRNHLGEKVYTEEVPTYGKKWVRSGKTKKEAKEWIAIGFEPDDLSLIKKWKKCNFSLQEIKEWTEAGLSKQDLEFAVWLKKNDYVPQTTGDNLAELRSSYNQHWLVENCPDYNVKELDISKKHLSGKIDLSQYNQLERLNCSGNQLTNVVLPNAENLVSLDISDNKLAGKLNLSSFVNLKKLICNKNELTFLNLRKQEKLETLAISSNKFPRHNPIWLGNLVNLKSLDLSDNNFTGSLEFIQSMSKLEELDIKGANFCNDARYFLELQRINCDKRTKKILLDYGSNLLRIYPQIIEQRLTGNNYDNYLAVVTTFPKNWNLKKDAEKQVTNQKDFELTSSNYSKFSLQSSQPFSWEKTIKKQPQQLPLRLYNVATDQIVETNSVPESINAYAALSYCWGTDWEPEIDRIVTKSDGQTYNVKLTKLGRKAINKVKQTFALINKEQTNLQHIWIDNYCINQGDNQEKGEEVRKQKIYYNGAAATLIAIDAKIGDLVSKEENKYELAKHIIRQIVNSQWFTRAWTFQEGLLSRQTIFMFDDAVVDGRLLAYIWSATQDRSKDNDEWVRLNTTIFITPLGWSQDSHWGKSVNLGLSQALAAVQHRQQTVAVDGIYSILGLLPYGEQIEPKYKDKGHTYTNEELEEILLEVMKVTVANNHHAPLLWTGERRNEPELWWIPSMSDNKKITSIEWFTKPLATLEGVKITRQGFELAGGWRAIDGEYISIVAVYKSVNDSEQYFHVLVPEEENIHLPVKIIPDYSLVSEFLQWYCKSSKMFIDMVNKKVIEGEKAIKEYQAQIEVLPH